MGRISYMYKKYLAHRLAFECMGEAIPEKVDHANGVTCDNSWKNLRGASSVQNAGNSSIKANSSSRFKGVYFTANRKNPWKVELGNKGKSIYYGYYRTEEEAGAVARKAHLDLYAEYSIYNRKELSNEVL